MNHKATADLNHSLILVSDETRLNVKEIVRYSSLLIDKCEWGRASCIYSRDEGREYESRALQSVVYIKTRFSLQELEELVFSVSKVAKHASGKVLAFNDLVQINPERLIPDKSLAFDPLVIFCAQEVAPDFIHPIINVELKELVTRRSNNGYSFISQGEAYKWQRAC